MAKKTIAASAPQGNSPLPAAAVIYAPHSKVPLGKRVIIGDRCLLELDCDGQKVIISLEEIAAALYGGLQPQFTDSASPPTRSEAESEEKNDAALLRERLLLRDCLLKAPESIGDAKLDTLLYYLQQVSTWIDEVFLYAGEQASNKAYEWRDYKAVHAYNRHKFKNPAEVVRIAEEAGIKEIYRLKTPQELEKLLGRSRFYSLFGNCLSHSKGACRLICKKTEG